MADNNQQSSSAVADDLSVNDIVDLLGQDDDQKTAEVKEETPLDTKPSEKPGKEDEDEIHAEESDDKEEIKLEEEDDLTFKDIPKRQAILKEFPELFKKFPGIESAIYREQQYAEVFPTINDAKEAQARNEDYNKFEQSLLSGNIESVLASVKNTDEKAFGRITATFLQTLGKVDEKAYYATINHVIKSTLKTAFDTGKTNNNEQLQIAAQLINQFIYNSQNITVDQIQNNQQQEENPREQELKNRETQFAKQQLGIAVNDVSGRTENVIKSTIDKHLDVKNVMTPNVKRNAVNDIMREVDKEIGEDTRFKAILDKLWEQSFKENYSEASKLKIRNALLSKAKTILPAIMQRVKGEALKGQSNRNREVAENSDKRPIAQGRPSNSSPKTNDPKSLPKGMKTIDFLNSD
jgi:hypothetical protein